MDRCLRPVRVKSVHGPSITKRGSLLRRAIPVRTFTNYDEKQSDFLDIDLVAHFGETTAGQDLNRLADPHRLGSAWTDPVVLWRHTQGAVRDALQAMRPNLPAPLLGLD